MAKTTEFDPAYNVEKAAEYLSVSPDKLRKMAQSREIEYVKRGGLNASQSDRLKFRLSALNKWLDSNTVRIRKQA